MDRRGFLTAASTIIAAPAIVTSKGFWLPSDNYNSIMAATEVRLRQEMKKVMIDAVIYGNGAYKVDSGVVKHIPIAEVELNDGSYKWVSWY